jgi:hypothetical protein
MSWRHCSIRRLVQVSSRPNITLCLWELWFWCCVILDWPARLLFIMNLMFVVSYRLLVHKLCFANSFKRKKERNTEKKYTHEEMDAEWSKRMNGRRRERMKKRVKKGSKREKRENKLRSSVNSFHLPSHSRPMIEVFQEVSPPEFCMHFTFPVSIAHA